MGRKSTKSKDEPKKLNVEIAPGNREKLESYLAAYNSHEDRKTPKLKYTDVLNAALDSFLQAHCPVEAPQQEQEKNGEAPKAGGKRGRKQ
jgi:hypothetical protein